MGTPSKLYPDHYVDEPSTAWKADGKKSFFKLGSEADEIPFFKFRPPRGERDRELYLGEEANHKCRIFIVSGENPVGEREIQTLMRTPRHTNGLPLVKKQSTRRRFKLHLLKWVMMSLMC